MRDHSPLSPEERRKRLATMRAAFGTEVEEKLKPRLTAWEVVKRVAIGVYNDGFSFSSTSVPNAARMVASRLRRSSGDRGEWSLISGGSQTPRPARGLPGAVQSSTNF